MKQQIFTFILVAMLGVVSSGCEKDTISTTDKVELYLLDSYATISESYQIDESTINTQSSPLVSYEDFISYNSTNYTFELSDQAKSTIANMDHSVNGIAFALKAGGTIVYSGYFWPSYSSASCDWVVINPLMTGISNEITVSIGYPGLIEGQVIPDRRNDSRIIDVFKSDNKLID